MSWKILFGIPSVASGQKIVVTFLFGSFGWSTCKITRVCQTATHCLQLTLGWIMCEEGNLPVCHITGEAVHFLCPQEATGTTFCHAPLELWQPSEQTHACICVNVCASVLVCKNREDLLWSCVFSCVWTCTSARGSNAHQLVRQTLRSVCVVVCFSVLSSLPLTQVKSRFSSKASISFLLGAVCHNSRWWCKMRPSRQRPTRCKSLW